MSLETNDGHNWRRNTFPLSSLMDCKLQMGHFEVEGGDQLMYSINQPKSGIFWDYGNLYDKTGGKWCIAVCNVM